MPRALCTKTWSPRIFLWKVGRSLSPTSVSLVSPSSATETGRWPSRDFESVCERVCWNNAEQSLNNVPTLSKFQEGWVVEHPIGLAVLLIARNHSLTARRRQAWHGPALHKVIRCLRIRVWPSLLTVGCLPVSITVHAVVKFLFLCSISWNQRLRLEFCQGWCLCEACCTFVFPFCALVWKAAALWTTVACDSDPR